MPPLRSCLAILVSLMLPAGLIGCGQTSSDNAPSLESGASVGGPPLSKQGPSPGNNPLTPVTQTASPVPLALGNETGVASGKETAPGGDNAGQGDKLSKPAGMSNVEIDGQNKMSVPDIPGSLAMALESPDARVRLQALDHWGKKGNNLPLDPLFAALDDDEDEQVQAKVTEIIERYWAVEQEQERK